MFDDLVGEKMERTKYLGIHPIYIQIKLGTNQSYFSVVSAFRFGGIFLTMQETLHLHLMMT
jgi:hypothetical protein